MSITTARIRGAAFELDPEAAAALETAARKMRLSNQDALIRAISLLRQLADTDADVVELKKGDLALARFRVK
jgi:hypothetical protein